MRPVTLPYHQAYQPKLAAKTPARHDLEVVAEELFTAAELQTIREQYDERLRNEQRLREEGEWEFRRQLAHVKLAQQQALSAASELNVVVARLEQVLNRAAATQAATNSGAKVVLVNPPPMRAAARRIYS